MANAVLQARKSRIRKFDNVRFRHGNYEYKLAYEGGFFGFITVYRRPFWKPRGRFEYVRSFPEDDLSMKDVIGFIKEQVA